MAAVDAVGMLLATMFRKPHPRPGAAVVAEISILHPKSEQETLLRLSQQKVMQRKQEAVVVLEVHAFADAVECAAFVPYRDIVGSACLGKRQDGPS